MKNCKQCQQDLPLEDFAWTDSRHKYRKRTCKGCIYDDSVKKRQKAYYDSNKKMLLAHKRSKRKRDVVGTIWIDSRSTDRKVGRENNLTKEFIAGEIAKGCSYCGESSIRMTLDRIDNEKGHTQDNVVPACIRCNYTRRNMPYEAWLVVAKGMQEARLAGLFNGWTGRVKRAKAT